jgi:parallel beta-helix repeat protein
LASIGPNEAFIFVECSDIIFNGAGYTVQGSGLGSAFCLLRCQNVTVENFVIRGFSRGVDFWAVDNLPSDASHLSKPSASDNKIVGNKIEVGYDANSSRIRDRGWCIYLNDASYTVVSGNTFISRNLQGGVYFGNLTKNTNFSNNNFLGCSLFSIVSDKTVATGNTVDGKPLIYLEGQSNQVIEDAGVVYLFNCSNVVVKNVTPLYDYSVAIQLINTVKSEVVNSCGKVLLINSSQNNIHDNQFTSLIFDNSSYNTLFANIVTGYSLCMKLYRGSNFNNIYNNVLLDTTYSAEAEGVRAAGSETVAIQLGDLQFGGVFNNAVHNNTLVNHDCAIKLVLSSNNTLANNLLQNSRTGLMLGASHYNIFTENNVTSCKFAVGIHAAASNNTFLCNNFVNNDVQCVETHNPTLFLDGETFSIGNVWDDGKMGNYWSTYNGVDANNDGIGDIPYIVFEYMIDNYPLIEPFKIVSSLPQYSQSPQQTAEINNSLLNRENLLIILAIGIILAVASGLLIYFRHLIFR